MRYFSLLSTKLILSYQIISYTSELLMFVMFTMEVTLSIDDFKRVIVKPKAVIACTLLRYIVMPLTALILAKVFDMQPALLHKYITS